MDTGLLKQLLGWVISGIGAILGAIASGLWLFHKNRIKDAREKDAVATALLNQAKRIEELEKSQIISEAFQDFAGKQFVKMDNVIEKVENLEDKIDGVLKEQTEGTKILYQIKGHLQIKD